MRYELRPLGPWTDKVTDPRAGAHRFKASWDDTLELLARETKHLGADLVVVQIDVEAGDLRRDGMLRTRARVGFPGVAISFESDHGHLRYATDAYEHKYSDDMTSWQANVRAIALGLEALRAVDRYGISKRGEQYRGWTAITSGRPGEFFANRQEALTWMRKAAGVTDGDVADPAALYKRLARTMHPDMPDGNQELWDRLESAAAYFDFKRGTGGS